MCLKRYQNKMSDDPENFAAHLDANNKENKTNSKRQQRTKKEQFDMLIDFFRINNESLMDSETFHKSWGELVVALNGIGPPHHTVMEWRRVWSDFKYNKKRKRSDVDFEGFGLKWH